MAVRKPYPAKVNGQPAHLVCDHEHRLETVKNYPDIDPLTIGRVAVGLFHTKREREYLAASYIDERGDEHWTMDFNAREMMLWLGGVALDEEDQRILHLANRSNGSFEERYGWRPVTRIEYEPDEDTEELYVQHELQDLDRTYGFPPDFYEATND